MKNIFHHSVALFFIFSLYSCSPSTKQSSKPQEEPYTYVDEMPELEGSSDIQPIISFIKQRAKCPNNTQRDSAEGRVVASFIVEIDGTVTEAKIVNGIGRGCNESVLKAIHSLPRFKPGKQRGKAVRVLKTVPIIFELDPVNRPLQLPNYGLNGRLLITSHGRASAFNDYEDNHIKAKGINFYFDFKDTRANSGMRAGEYLINDKVVGLRVAKLSSPTDTSSIKIIENYVKPWFLSTTNKELLITPSYKRITINSYPATLWMYDIQEGHNSQYFLTFVHKGYIFALKSGKRVNEDVESVQTFLINTASFIKFSDKPIVLTPVDK